MKISRKMTVLFAVALVSFAVHSERVDAVNKITNAWQDRKWSTARSWDSYQVPGDGGIASYDHNNAPADREPSQNYIYQNIVGITLKGLDFGNFWALKMYGEDITFDGEAPWISTARKDAANYARTSIKMVGSGSNQLLKKGAGRLLLETPPANFSSLDIVDGTLVITNGAGVDTLCANGVPVNVKYGTLSVENQDAEGAARLATLVNGAGVGTVSVSEGSLAVGSLTKDPGGILNVSTTDGGKFLVSGKDGAVAPDGGMISLSGRTISFLDYDAVEGWKAGSSVPANAKVFGAADDANDTVVETGDISFGTDEGYVYRPAPTGATTLKVTGSMTVPKDGITFASIPSATGARVMVDFSGSTSQLDGKLRFQGVSVLSTGLTQDKIAKTADITVCGSASESPSRAGLLNFSVAVLKEKPLDFTLRLAGSSTDSLSLNAEGGNWQYKVWTKQGSTIFDDDATVGSIGGNVRLVFSGPVTGRGGLWCKSGVVELANGGNAFAGDIKVNDGAVLAVTGDGVLGSGDVKLLNSGARLNFQALKAPLAVYNYFLSKVGTLTVQGKSMVALLRPTQFSTTYVQNGSVLKIGSDLRTDMVYLDADSTLSSVGSDASLTVAGSGTAVLAGQLKDGGNSSKLSLVKDGSGLLVMSGKGSYTGETKVNGGTLKIGGSLFSASDVSWWLDPSDPSTVTTSADGMVTRINSKVGSVHFDKEANIAAPHYVTDDTAAFNGRNFLRFDPEGSGNVFSTHPRLSASAATENRTVYIVFKTTRSATHGALIGYNWQDISLRVGSDGSIDTADAPRQDYWPTSNEVRFDGVMKNTAIYTKSDAGTPHILGLFVPSHYTGSGGYNHFTRFTPVLGDNQGRTWGGDIGEIIAFNRVLCKAECCAVENYLREKWNPDLFKAHSAEDCALPSAACLPEATDLSIAPNATLDLNGADQTVASLAGDGTIVNTSDKPARLVVVGDSSGFRGSVVGDVTLVVASGSRDIVLRNGARLVLNGAGESTIRPANPHPPMHDLAFWLDASCEETTSARTNETGQLANWMCRSNDLCEVKFFRNTASGDEFRPVFEPKGWNDGKPAVLLPNAKSVITATSSGTSNKSVKLLTLFYVTKPVYNGYSYAFGQGGDVGITLSVWDANSGVTVNMRSPSMLNACGDLIHVNGVDYTLTKDTSMGINNDTKVCYVMRSGDAHASDSSFDKVWMFGSYSGSRGVKQYIAEAIGYTVQLSDAELLATEKYLMDKWFNSGTEWPAQETEAFDSSCGFGVAAGATLDFGAANVTLASVEGQGGTISTDGTLTVNDSFVFSVDAEGKVSKLTVDGNLAIGSQAVAVFLNGEGLSRSMARQDALEVTGEVSGGELSTAQGVPNNWSWANFGKVWAICRRGLMILIR